MAENDAYVWDAKDCMPEIILAKVTEERGR